MKNLGICCGLLLLCSSSMCKADDVNSIDLSADLLGTIACGSSVDCDVDGSSFNNIKIGKVNPVPGEAIEDTAKKQCRDKVKRMVGTSCGALYECAGCPEGQTGCTIGWKDDEGGSVDDLSKYTVKKDKKGNYTCNFDPSGDDYDAKVVCSECVDCAPKPH